MTSWIASVHLYHPSSHSSPHSLEADLHGMPERAPLLLVGDWPLGEWEKKEVGVFIFLVHSLPDLPA